MKGELRKSEVLLILSTLLVVKAENIYQNTTKDFTFVKFTFKMFADESLKAVSATFFASLFCKSKGRHL